MPRNDAILLISFFIAIGAAVFGPAFIHYWTAADHSSFADWLTAFGTMLLAGIAWTQIRALSATSRADFIHRLNSDFYTLGSRDIRTFLDNSDVVFTATDHQGVFSSQIANKSYTDEAVDDLVLGPLEAIAIFYFKGVVDLPMTYEMFGTYVIRIWEMPAIRSYIAWSQNRPDSFDVYDKLEKLYDICISYYQKKRRIADVILANS